MKALSTKDLIQGFLISIFACLVSMGAILSDQFTLSPLFYQSSLHDLNRRECQPTGKDWTCTNIGVYSGNLYDSGAVNWVDIPISYYRNKVGNALWDPYIGSGYPLAFDGHNRTITPSRIFLKNFPNQQGKDFWIFFRFVVFCWGFVTLFQIAGFAFWTQILGAVLATLLPYPAFYIDIVFMDTDMMAPWIIVWFMFANRKFDKWLFIALSALLGVWIGIQSFVQAQVVFGLVIGLYFLTLMITAKERKIPFIGFTLFCIGYFAFLLPDSLHYFINLDHLLIGARNPGTCFANNGLAPLNLLKDSVQGFYKSPEAFTLFSLTGICLVWLNLIRNKKYLILNLIFLILLIGNINGLPHFICNFNVFSGIRIFRHLTAHTQSLFYFLLCSACVQVKIRKKLYQVVFILFGLLSIMTFVKRGTVNEKIFSGTLGKEYEFTTTIPDSHPFRHIQLLSQNEDRRHIAFDERLFPNWPTAFEILDLRFNLSFQVKYSHLLYTSLFNSWKNDSGIPTIPDRFTTPTANIEFITPELEKLLILTRTSLLSFSSKTNWLPKSGLYSKDTCIPIANDGITQSWVCSKIGGVGFFPTRVEIADDDDQIINLMQHSNPTDLIDKAWILNSEIKGTIIEQSPVTGALGSIKAVERKGDDLVYTLDIRQPGFFIIADTWFPGWSASLDGEKVKIFRASIAWKGIYIPKIGQGLKLKLHFEP